LRSSEGCFWAWAAGSDPCCLGRAWRGFSTIPTANSVFSRSLHWSLEDKLDPPGANSIAMLTGERGPWESSRRRKAGGGRPAVLLMGPETPFLLPLLGSQPLPRSPSPACPSPPVDIKPAWQVQRERQPRGNQPTWKIPLAEETQLPKEKPSSPASALQAAAFPAGRERRAPSQHGPQRGERDPAQGCQRVCVFPYSRSLLCSF